MNPYDIARPFVRFVAKRSDMSLLMCLLMTSSSVTAAREFTPDDTVLKAPLKMPETNSPGMPGNSPRISITYKGRS
uniref:Putative secreted protein n=1 Tax=Ixodes ricinus TaxID=34613 RepID=A0A6B0UBB3_IXORI